MNASTYTEADIKAHQALVAAGHVGMVNARHVSADGLLWALYACQDAGLAKYDHATETPQGTIGAVFFFVYA